MNGKTVKKLLMRGRHNSFWGRRAFITARLPLSIIPEPPPPPLPSARLGENTGLGGHFARKEGDVWVLTNIDRPSSSGDPRKWEDKEVPPRFVEEEYPGASYSYFRWWEIKELVVDNYDEVVNSGYKFKFNILETREGPLDILELYRARYNWTEKWLHGLQGETGAPILDRFLAAGNWAKTTYPDYDDSRGIFTITYSVKWFYPYRKYRFCADLSHAVKAAKRAGVPVRVYKC